MEPGGVGSTEPPESGGRRLGAAGNGTARASFEPAGAGALLGGVTAAGVGVGALIGWAAGSVGLGILGGAFVGVPAGVFAVYVRYKDTL
jgi:hypothetical protein